MLVFGEIVILLHNAVLKILSYSRSCASVDHWLACPVFPSSSLSVLHWNTEEEAVVMETTGPEAVQVHSQEGTPWHSRVPTTEEVHTQIDTVI